MCFVSLIISANPTVESLFDEVISTEMSFHHPSSDLNLEFDAPSLTYDACAVNYVNSSTHVHLGKALEPSSLYKSFKLKTNRNNKRKSNRAMKKRNKRKRGKARFPGSRAKKEVCAAYS